MKNQRFGKIIGMRGFFRCRTRGIRGKMTGYVWVCLLPVLALLLASIFSMYRYCRQYNQLVTNITGANQYNTRFKSEMDEMMYRIIIGSANWTDPETKLRGEDPKGYLAEAREHFSRLQETTEGVQVQTDLRALIKLIGVLDERVDDILSSVEEGGHYDENMEMLDLNIRTLTTLIQRDIQVYIYDEVTSMENLRREVSAHLMLTIRILLFLLLVLIGFVSFMSRSLARRITDPILTLCETTAQVAKGDFSVRCQVSAEDETRQLAESFNAMVSELSVLVRDIRQEQKNARDAELRLLQEQINPHFLYNTLDAIIWLTEAGDRKEAVRMTRQLSGFFRTTLSKGRDLVRVREEEQHIRSYLEIQQFRYRDILRFAIDFDPAVGDCEIQKLTLQPIIENALYHGIKNRRGGGVIRVTGKEEEGALVFTVSDDGIGMRAEELAALREQIRSGPPRAEESGFGMANVQARIVMQYGKEYGLSIESEYGTGTCVTVRLPRRIYEEKSAL